jgi:hypothetical protein
VKKEGEMEGASGDLYRAEKREMKRGGSGGVGAWRKRGKVRPSGIDMRCRSGGEEGGTMHVRWRQLVVGLRGRGPCERGVVFGLWAATGHWRGPGPW